MKFSLQWNFGRKMQRCPAASMVSWTSDFWARKSGWCSRTQVAQHVVAVGSHLVSSQQIRSIPGCQRLCSWRMAFIPFGWFGKVRWLGGNTIGWETHTPPVCINHPSWMYGTLPPGFRLIFWTCRVSFGHVEWPWESSTIIRAWYSGPCSLLKTGIILFLIWQSSAQCYVLSKTQFHSASEGPNSWQILPPPSLTVNHQSDNPPLHLLSQIHLQDQEVSAPHHFFFFNFIVTEGYALWTTLQVIQ